MVITERKENWLFYWNFKAYLETKEFSQTLAGNGPILVSKQTGDFEAVGTAPPLSERIEEAESSMKSRSNKLRDQIAGTRGTID